jgi:hypothetical protein
MALSVDVGRTGVSPVAAKVLLLRNEAFIPAERAEEIIGVSQTEPDAQRLFFEGRPAAVRALSSEVHLALKEAAIVEGHDSQVDDYKELIELLVSEIRQALSPKIKGAMQGRPERLILPENLRGVTALTMGQRG